MPGPFHEMAKRHWAKYLPALTRGLKEEGIWESETEEAAEKAKEELVRYSDIRGT